MRRRLHGEEPWDAGNIWAIGHEECWMFLAPEKKQRMRMPVLDLEGYMEPSDFCTHHLSFDAFKWVKGGYIQWKNEYSWVNTPIICTVGRLRVLPKALQHILPKATPDDIERESEQTGQLYNLETTRASIWFDESVDNYERVPFPYDYSYEEAFLKQLGGAVIPESLHLPMKACLPTLNLEPGSNWFLRNLTDQEYIRMEAVVTPDDEATISLPGRKWLTLDILLLWVISWKADYRKNRKTTWSWEQLETFEGFTDRDVSDACQGPGYGPMCSDFWPIWVGPWAGHRLYVIIKERLDNGWKDRTENITRLAPKMLRVFYGRSLAMKNEHQEYWEEAFRQDGDQWKFRESSPFPWEDFDLDWDKPKQRLSRIT
ncbi:hypothetical protein QWA68_010322 [Fusarium oxysporum]|nr:hypothetical protein QWA68_010322 [Fusarium oxysporum]